MSAAAAAYFAAEAALNPSGAFGFATGGTPVGMYAELLRMKADLRGIRAFNLDEYHPIKKDDPQSYYRFMQENLFNAANVTNTAIPDGEAADAEAECAAYEARLNAAGGIDLQILGIGANGHIGFNEPSDCFSKGTSYVPLTESTIKANARFFASPGDVPKNAITMGIRSIMAARKIMLLASGAGKAEILRDALRGPITPRVPASALQLHPNVTVFADEAAAALL